VDNTAKYSKNFLENRRIDADFSELSVFSLFCGIFCALKNTLQTAKISGDSSIGARKQREKLVLRLEFGTSGGTRLRACLTY